MNRGPLVQPIIQHAGEDISHWFDEKTCDVKTHLDPERHIRVPFLPHGRFLDVPPPDPVSNWSTRSDKSWWQVSLLRDIRHEWGFIAFNRTKRRIVSVI